MCFSNCSTPGTHAAHWLPCPALQVQTGVQKAAQSSSLNRSEAEQHGSERSALTEMLRSGAAWHPFISSAGQ
ncbi:hypothetical protein SRHO_G00231260 [Serrasalmus rhombeus]